jgi:hypothetical protein
MLADNSDTAIYTSLEYSNYRISQDKYLESSSLSQQYIVFTTGSLIDDEFLRTNRILSFVVSRFIGRGHHPEKWPLPINRETTTYLPPFERNFSLSP